MLTKGQKALFDYLNEKMITDEFTRLIESTVVSAKSNAEWRREFIDRSRRPVTLVMGGMLRK